MPGPLEIGGVVFDVVDDLCAFTKLPRERAGELLQRRHESFRSEWQSFPAPVRSDHWYYLSSRAYLFANAIHLHDQAPFVRELIELIPDGGHALDYGGGTGNLALAAAAAGHTTTYVELSAIQRDFMRFRIARHGLQSRVNVLDWWEPLPERRFDVVFALDVLEHLPNLSETLRSSILPSMVSGGKLVEASPFVRTLSNPMHHEDAAILDETLVSAGYLLQQVVGAIRVWSATDPNDGE